MSKVKDEKIRRQWGQWKRRYLSKRDIKNLDIAMIIEFAIVKGHFDYMFSNMPII